MLNVCRDCIEKMLKQHPNDLEFANKLCQWADIPFNPSEWIQLYETNQERTFTVYHGLYCSEDRVDIPWIDYNEKWIDALKRGTLEDELDFFSAEKFHKLQLKWGINYDQEEINYLEQLMKFFSTKEIKFIF